MLIQFKTRLKTYVTSLDGNLIEFVRRGLICKRLRDYDLKHSECLCSELTFTNKKWICLRTYRPTESSNLSTFFEELSIFLHCKFMILVMRRKISYQAKIFSFWESVGKRSDKENIFFCFTEITIIFTEIHCIETKVKNNYQNI